MNGSKRLVALIVFAALLVVLGFLLWRPSAPDAARREASDVTAAETSSAALASVDLAASEARAADEARRVVDDVPNEAAVGASDAALPTESSEAIVRVAVADGAWLRSVRDGRLVWSDGRDAGVSYRIRDEHVALPRPPNSIQEFSQISIAGLALRATALEPVDDGSATAFVLRVEYERGATLVWAPSVAFEHRGPVDLAIGGFQAPSADVRVKTGARPGLVDVRRGLELPFVLPRSTESTRVWVGAPGLQWRGFTVEPTDEFVEVALDPTASIRVIHEATSDARVAVQSLPRGRALGHAIVDANPVVIDGLASGRHRVWIEAARASTPVQTSSTTVERPSREVLSHAVEIELVAGETIDVDLRAAAALVDLGGVRVFVRIDAGTLALLPANASGPAALALALTLLPTDGSQSRQTPAPKRTATTGSGDTYESLGLTPGRYFVLVKPFAAWAEVDVLAGAMSDVEIDVGCVGFVRLALPTGTGSVFFDISLDRIDRPAPDGAKLVIEIPGGSPAELDIPLACGNYSMRLYGYGGPDSGRIESDPFTVTAGATTVVELRATPKTKARVEAVDAATGESIGFDTEYWVRVRAFDLESGADVTASISFTDASNGVLNSVNWTLLPHNGLVRVTAPEHPAWTFEPIESLYLTDGATVTLRATAK
jgi:hypothetical protein